jgi:hypothetical protein
MPHVVDAAVLVEAVVLDRQHRLLHHVRDVLEAHQGAALLAEFADQDVIGREDPQRHLRPVVGQGVERGQVRVGHRQREHDHQHAAHGQAGQGGEGSGRCASGCSLFGAERRGLPVGRCFHAVASLC